MIPSVGRIVHYRLTEHDAESITYRRRQAIALMGTTQAGIVLGVGNPVKAGDLFPMMITRVWSDNNPTEETTVQGQVFLDGDDTLWVTSVSQHVAMFHNTDDSIGTWFEPSRT